MPVECKFNYTIKMYYNSFVLVSPSLDEIHNKFATKSDASSMQYLDAIHYLGFVLISPRVQANWKYFKSQITSQIEISQ